MRQVPERQLRWMQRIAIVGSIVMAGLLAGCSSEGQLQVASLPSDAIEIPAEVLRAESTERLPFATGTPTIIYLHFDGLVITKGYKSDSSTNTSYLGGGTIPPFVGDQATRDQVISLMKQLYAAYNVQIVTARPTSGSYTMAVFGGRPSSIGLPYTEGTYGGVVGIAPLDCSASMLRDIAFIFTDSIKTYVPNGYVKTSAETGAHETAHTFGLPHSNDGCDLMSYGTCSTIKTFLDKNMGMQNATANNCGMTTMNSHQLLLKALGPATAQPPPTSPTPTTPPSTTPSPDTQAPAVNITSPASGARVPATVTVKAMATDNQSVTRVDLLLDGKIVASRTTPPFEFPLALTNGQHTVVVNAYDAANNKGSASVTVSVDDPAAPAPTDPATPQPDPAAPPPDAVPPPAAPGTFGAPCEAPGDCTSGLCADDPATGKYCTDACDPAAPQCSGGATCLPAIGQSANVCSAPLNLNADPDSRLIGSCSMGFAAAELPPLWPVLLAFGLFLAQRRRRR